MSLSYICANDHCDQLRWGTGSFCAAHTDPYQIGSPICAEHLGRLRSWCAECEIDAMQERLELAEAVVEEMREWDCPECPRGGGYKEHSEGCIVGSKFKAYDASKAPTKTGGSKPPMLLIPIQCPDCDGGGVDLSTGTLNCSRCLGEGEVEGDTCHVDPTKAGGGE